MAPPVTRWKSPGVRLTIRSAYAPGNRLIGVLPSAQRTLRRLAPTRVAEAMVQSGHFAWDWVVTISVEWVVKFRGIVNQRTS